MRKLLLPLILSVFLVGCNNNVTPVNSTPIKEYTPTLPTFENKNVGAPKIDEDGKVLFDFYEFSDFHGATEYNPSSGELGLAHLSSYFDVKRENNKGGTILLSSGDMWQGTADSNLTYGNLVTYSMNVMGMDAMQIGNHEFDWSTDWIKNNEERANFPFLCANLLNKGTTQKADLLPSSTVIERGEYKIGVVGTIGDTIRGSILESAVEKYEFGDEVETVSLEADKLRNEQDCDIVVWLTHNDVNDISTKLSTEVADKIDLVFGGHSHSNLSITKGDLHLLETRNYGRAVAHATLSLDPTTGEVTTKVAEIDDNLTATQTSEDASIKMIYDQYLSNYITPVKNERVGKVNGRLTIEETLSNLAVSAMKETALSSYPDMPVVASFHNRAGGVRANIESGNVIYGDVYKSFPFDNEIVILKVLGYYLKSYLNENNYALWQNIKLSEVKTNDEYYIVTTDYLSSGTNPFTKYSEIVYTKQYVRDVVANTIKNKSSGGGCSTSGLNANDYTLKNHPEFSKAA